MRSTRPFVDRPVPDRDAAHILATSLAETWELPAPRLLRHGMNSLYVCGEVVLRVGAATAPASAAHRVVRWLLEHDVPTVTPVEGLAADVDGMTVTGWHLVRETRQAIDWERVGATVRRVHELPLDDVPPDYPVPDPASFPWWQFDEMLAGVADDIDAGALHGLTETVERRRGWSERLRDRPVLCHGDVHPGNVMTSAEGPLLVDWDLMCVADPAWDHAMLTTYATRWGGRPGTYERFATGYGDSFVDDDLTVALGELRNVAATIMRVVAGRTDPAAAAEAERRLRFWRGEADAPMWQAQ